MAVQIHLDGHGTNGDYLFCESSSSFLRRISLAFSCCSGVIDPSDGADAIMMGAAVGAGAAALSATGGAGSTGGVATIELGSTAGRPDGRGATTL